MEGNYYETDRALAEYLLFHYGTPSEVLPHEFGPQAALNYPARCVSECLDVSRLPNGARALDLGCAVGRSTFELARHCSEVIGIDYSRQFVSAAALLKQNGEMLYSITTEGQLMMPAQALVPPEIDRRRVQFEAGDAVHLRNGLGTFDAVLLANLIDRVSKPRVCLEQMAGLLRSGGQLIITSPYTWLLDYTPRENWLGGFEREGGEVHTLDTLKEILSPAFEFKGRKDLPFLIREHARKFQWSVAEATVWVRR